MYLDDTVDISVDFLAFQVFRGNCSFTQMLELQSRNNISLFFFFSFFFVGQCLFMLEH